MLLLLMSSALGRDRILWYEGNVGYTSAVTTAFTTALTGVGIAGVDRTTSWPTTFSPYAMIVVAGPALSFTAPQVADLQQLIADGGLVVLLGDNATGFGGRNNIINGIASSLGVGMQIAGGSYDPNCWQVGVPATVGHPFLEGSQQHFLRLHLQPQPGQQFRPAADSGHGLGCDPGLREWGPAVGRCEYLRVTLLR